VIVPVYPAVDQAAAADDLARLQLAQIQSVHDARAAYAARRSEAARSEAAVAADARHVERMHQARMHRIDMNRRRAAAVAAEVVEAAAAAEAAAMEEHLQSRRLREAECYRRIEADRVASHNRALAVLAERVAAGLVGWGGAAPAGGGAAPAEEHGKWWHRENYRARWRWHQYYPGCSEEDVKEYYRDWAACEQWHRRRQDRLRRDWDEAELWQRAQMLEA
jgi:hypothetical protein